MHFPADPLLDPSIFSKPTTGGSELVQSDHHQHVPLSPKMAALWKNLMTDGASEAHGKLRVPGELTRGNSRSATPAAVGRVLQNKGHQSSAKEDDV